VCNAYEVNATNPNMLCVLLHNYMQVISNLAFPSTPASDSAWVTQYVRITLTSLLFHPVAAGMFVGTPLTIEPPYKTKLVEYAPAFDV